MAQRAIVYEQPLNELIRVMLRLEKAFNTLSLHMKGEAPWQSEQALLTIIDIMVILDRPDLKAKIVKELNRYIYILGRWSQKTQGDSEKLQGIIEKLETLATDLQAITGKFAQTLRENEFLYSLRQHRYNPVDTCNFDIPGFHYWLQQPFKGRYEHLTQWTNEFKTIERTIHVLLDLVRHCAYPEPRQAINGFYQEDLNRKVSLQLIRLAIPTEVAVYPETSVGLHRLSIRFHGPFGHDASYTIPSHLTFELTRCII